MLLAIDTATRMLSLALHDGKRLRCELSWETANRHTVEVSPAVVEVCKRAGITVQAVTAIAVSQGPGSFSGLRIGIGVAKGMAMALRVPLIAIPTLHIVAAAQPGPTEAHGYAASFLIAVAQAGRSRVCAGRYAWQGRWTPVSDVEIVGWEPLLASISSPVALAGELDDAALALIEASKKPIMVAPPAINLRRAGVLADLGWARLRESPVSDPASIVPIYVNQPGLPHP